MLKVNEIFGKTLQGEGKSVGIEVMFLRLAFCNCHCVWCDTKHTWDWSHYDKTKEVHSMINEQIIAQLNQGGVKNLVISGGEPLLQQKQLVSLLYQLKSEGWWIEIETNGTITPSPEMYELVDQFNCSPKLSNSGDSKKLRIREKTLESLALSSKVNFKFVVANQTDINEVLEYVNTFKMTQVYLMPLGKTREELQRTRKQTQELSARFGFHFSDRLHVVKFGGIRGV